MVSSVAGISRDEKRKKAGEYGISTINKLNYYLSNLTQGSFTDEELSAIKKIIVTNDWMQNLNYDISVPNKTRIHQ